MHFTVSLEPQSIYFYFVLGTQPFISDQVWEQHEKFTEYAKREGQGNPSHCPEWIVSYGLGLWH